MTAGQSASNSFPLYILALPLFFRRVRVRYETRLERPVCLPAMGRRTERMRSRMRSPCGGVRAERPIKVLRRHRAMASISQSSSKSGLWYLTEAERRINDALSRHPQNAGRDAGLGAVREAAAALAEWQAQRPHPRHGQHVLPCRGLGLGT